MNFSRLVLKLLIISGAFEAEIFLTKIAGILPPKQPIDKLEIFDLIPSYSELSIK